MSGAQAKAAVIAGAIGVVAEVDPSAANKRHQQGWVDELFYDLDELLARIRHLRNSGEAASLAFVGNVVVLWERLADEPELLVELGSDQTSLHNPFNGGYYPAELSFEEAKEVMANDKEKFKELVQSSLRRHVIAVNRMTARGMRFW